TKRTSLWAAEARDAVDHFRGPIRAQSLADAFGEVMARIADVTTRLQAEIGFPEGSRRGAARWWFRRCAGTRRRIRAAGYSARRTKNRTPGDRTAPLLRNSS